MTTTIQTITRRAFAGSQSREFEHILVVPANPELSRMPRRLRVHIDVDAYVDQSGATVEVWDGSKWAEVHRLRGKEMASWKKCSYVDSGPRIGAFLEDEAELLRVAFAVLDLGAVPAIQSAA